MCIDLATLHFGRYWAWLAVRQASSDQSAGRVKASHLIWLPRPYSSNALGTKSIQPCLILKLLEDDSWGFNYVGRKILWPLLTCMALGTVYWKHEIVRGLKSNFRIEYTGSVSPSQSRRIGIPFAKFPTQVELRDGWRWWSTVPAKKQILLMAFFNKRAKLNFS